MDFLSADVPDLTDFPPHTVAPGLRALDGSFRCDICGDLYDAPVTISCGHCFCSACIRVSLANKQECPSCRKSTFEVHIRPNPILDKVISDWKEARPFILQLLKKKEKIMETPEEDKATFKKRKRSYARGSSAETTLPSVHRPSSPDVQTLHHNSPSKEKKRHIEKDNLGMTIPSSDIEEDEISIPSMNLAPKDDDIVICPICEKRVIYQKLNGHIDGGCNESAANESAAKSWSKIMRGGKSTGKRKMRGSISDDEYPLPIQTYATLKDRQLKEMLQEYDLPVTGNRSNWEQRHQRWVMLYNSNLDRSSTNKKSRTELGGDLRKWEEEISKRKRIVIHNVLDYQIQQKDEFVKLVRAAKENKQSIPSSRSMGSNTWDSLSPSSNPIASSGERGAQTDGDIVVNEPLR